MLHNVGAAIASGGSFASTDNFDAAGDVERSKVGSLVNARPAIWSSVTANWTQWEGNPPDSLHGEADSAEVWARVAAMAVGRDTGGSTMRCIEARAAAAAQATTLYRLCTDALLRSYEVTLGTYHLPASLNEQTSVSVQGVHQVRASGFWGSRLGRRYCVTGVDAGTIAGAVGFMATTPSFLLVAGATVELVVRRIVASLVTPGTATSSQLIVKTDTADRFSAGGTARAPVTMNSGNAVATTVARNLELPTATAEGGGTRQVLAKAGGIIAGQPIEYAPEDGLIVPAGGSLLVYFVNATGAANYCYTIEWEERDIQ